MFDILFALDKILLNLIINSLPSDPLVRYTVLLGVLRIVYEFIPVNKENKRR